MDIKDLNKHQLILLAILLSFVTSIVTGITTVTLMQQAPDSVTVPINRVIKQTVEKIQQVEGKTTVNTVIVKEEDLVVDAIAKNKSSIFAVTRYNGESEDNAGKGFVISKDGVVVVDAVLVGDRATYYLKNDSGKFRATLVGSGNGLSFLKIGDPVDPTSKIAFTVPTFGDLSKIKVGQKIIILGSVISSIIFEGDKNIPIQVTKSNSGAAVLDLDGEVLGIALFNEVTPFASIDVINSVFAANVPKS